MLQLSGLVIKLGKSRDYYLLLVLVNIAVCLLIYATDVQYQYLLILTCGLFWQLFNLAKIKKPHPTLATIRYNGKQWILSYEDGTTVNYNKFAIRLNSGFFMLMVFYNLKPKSNIWNLPTYFQDIYKVFSINKDRENRPLLKISSALNCAKTRSTEPRCTLEHEDSSIESTKQFEAEVEFPKRSNIASNSKSVVVFYDQISAQQRRNIFILAKVAGD